MAKSYKLLTPGVELWNNDGEETLLLMRCPKCGKENWAPHVATGTCAWCGYDAHELLTSNTENNEKEQVQGTEMK